MCREVCARDDPSQWPDVEDPAIEHTMSARILQMLEMYRRLPKETGKQQPLIKNANAKGAMAAGEMGCHSATISSQVLDELSKLPYNNSVPTPVRLKRLAATDPLAAAKWDGKLARTGVDYLANDGAELENAIKSDPITATSLKDTLELFIGGENRSRAKVENALIQLA
ncbi:hypothetical protein BDV23DRAFT_177767 [Aspergillus alliaceus]|uniref:Uncharacterized protein n=1 Tax=Petromyces alliaceus TaxID=209559 RepID=A0A5N7CQN0_PETAA|nr:hypothetical protein BDV23DRAFT_177767 [Aspergillus alliaceus]